VGVAYCGQRFTFEVTRFLDQGGMGQVYEGTRQDDPAVRVAIKVPFPDYAATFLREAQVAERVAGPHVVPVVDWGDGPPFIAFQFIDGLTLRRVLDGRRARGEYWPETELIDLFRQLVDAMQAINTHVVHRDLTPGNVFDDAGVLRVSDFGLAKYAGDVTRADTHKGGGTYPYMAPEVWAFHDGRPDDAIDWHADQYSLGVMFYEMATLQRPFAGANSDLRAGHLYKRPSRVTDIVPSLSDRLASLITRMMEKQAGKRFARWDEIAHELDAIEQQRAVVARDDFAAGVSRQAAAQIEQMRGRTLEQQRQEDEHRQKVQQRLDLLNYWAGEIFDRLRERVEGVNRELGAEALFFKPVPPDGSIRWCVIGFADTTAQLAVELDVVEVDPPTPTGPAPVIPPGAIVLTINSPAPPDNVPLWGIVQLSTPRRGDAFNVILIEDTSPYGAWAEVTMAPPPGVRIGQDAHAFHVDQERGRRYRVVAKDPTTMVFYQAETVIALNWKALYERRPVPGQYGRNHNIYTDTALLFSEARLEFEGRLDELIRALVDNATG
jgi:hypothetical protein